MGFFDKMIDAMKIDDDDDYDDDFDDYEDEPEKKKGLFRKADSEEDDEEPVPEKKPVRAQRPASQKITPMRRPKGGAAAPTVEVCVIKPTSFEEVRDIAETLLCDRTVILNMEGLDMAIGQRIIDFMSGACYAIDGNLQKVSNYIFILTPKNVDISGDLQGIMDSFEISGLQTGF